MVDGKDGPQSLIWQDLETIEYRVVSQPKPEPLPEKPKKEPIDWVAAIAAQKARAS